MGHAPSKQHGERWRIDSQRQVSELDGRVFDDDARRGVRAWVLSSWHRDLRDLRTQEQRSLDVTLDSLCYDDSLAQHNAKRPADR